MKVEQVCSRLQGWHEAARHDREHSSAEEEGEGRMQPWYYYETIYLSCTI